MKLSSRQTIKQRPSWDEYFMKLAQVVRLRADCTRRKVGALIVKDKRIITTGYNGTPHGIKNCSEGGCERCQKRDQGKIDWYEYEESCVCIHAEQNAVIQAGYLGTSTKGATLYTTANPCSSCAKMLINAGIVRVVYQDRHHDKKGLELLKKGGVKVSQYSKI
jgi:dCMP deaminase